MLNLKLCNDRTEVDMNRLAQAFSITRSELEDCLRLGTIGYWYELGASDYDTPQMVFRSTESGRRVALDRVGNIVSRSDEGQEHTSPEPDREVARAPGIVAPRGRLELFPDEPLQETLPASHPIEVGIEADRLGA